MTDDNEERRRARLRALKQLRGQVRSQQKPETNVPPEDINPRRARLREMPQHRQAEERDAPRLGGRKRPQGLGERRGVSGGGNRPVRGLLWMARQHGDDLSPVADDNAATPALSRQDAGEGGGFGRLGKGHMLRRRLIQAQQHNDGPQQDTDSRLVEELQNRVRQLTEEVERLRANQAALDANRKRTLPVAHKKPTRRTPKKA
jgi:hypothetical protein